MKKTAISLADGRELIYFDRADDAVRDAHDTRPLGPTPTESWLRYDPLLDEWVIIAAHRQNRTYQPPADQCPLCPSRDGRQTEVPSADYDVVVFENRFPSLVGAGSPRAVDGTSDDDVVAPFPPLVSRLGRGRCEVVCFTSEHDKSFAELSVEQAATVLAAWTDRTAELNALNGVEQVFCFENRGQEIGVTLAHPHGQIYAYPFVTPRTTRVLASATAYRRRTGRNVFDDILAAERADGARVVIESPYWIAFVPYAAHWPYEVHLYPRRRVSDMTSLTEAERADWCQVYLDLLRRFDRLFATPAPYIAGWHQAPPREAGEFALHMEVFTIRRASDKLKYLAGSESGMGAFANDVTPEDAAARLREVG
jgi:UDPglucose--hexose-1-phosphate uridylyltransferase